MTRCSKCGTWGNPRKSYRGEKGLPLVPIILGGKAVILCLRCLANARLAGRDTKYPDAIQSEGAQL